MKLAAKELREEVKAEAKASTRGAIKKEGATGYTARLRYIENGKERAMLGPSCSSERRAQIDLDKLRAAAQGKEIQTVGFAAMRAKNQEDQEEADMENRDASGSAQSAHQPA